MVALPNKPLDLKVSVEPSIDALDGKKLGSPRKLGFLFAAEWSWSPAHSASDNYYLNHKRNYWVLWLHYLSEFDYNWRWSLIAYAPRIKADPKTVAIHLLIEAFKWRKKEEGLDQFHGITSNEFLNFDEIQAIAREVWGDDSA